MTKAEQKQVDEIKRLEAAVHKTKSPFLKRDYEKAIKRMKKELQEYRAFMYGGKVCK